MQMIKKYANRKLYHTNRKQYITLDGIAELIRSGEHVQVIENESGADITAAILAQVALQNRPSGWPSTGALADLIRTSSGRIADVGRSLLVGFGGGSLVEAEIAERIAHLHEQGRITVEEADRMRDLLVHGTPDKLYDLASQSDIAQLRAQVDALTAVVDQLLGQQAT